MKKIIYTDKAPKPIGAYSQAVSANGLIFVSGQIALDENGHFNNETLICETQQVMKNIGAILAQENLDYSHIVKCSIFLYKMSDFKEVNEVYAHYFKNDPPARETVEVVNLPKDARVEISCIAVKS